MYTLLVLLVKIIVAISIVFVLLSVTFTISLICIVFGKFADIAERMLIKCGSILIPVSIILFGMIYFVVLLM